MGTTQQRLATLAERREAVQRELSDIARNLPGSDNTALADLESALTNELSRIDQQIKQLQAYILQIQPEPEPGRS